MSDIYLDSDVRKFTDKIAATGAKPLYELTPEEARQTLSALQNDRLERYTPDIREINVPLSGKQSMRVLIINAAGHQNPVPVIFYLHGGGWVMGDENTHARLINSLAAQTNAAVVFPVYTPSPEAQYPTTTENLFTVLQYISANAKDLNLDSQKIVVAGDSAGGNMATVMALMAKQNGNQPPILFQLLFYPVTSAELQSASYQQFANGPWLTQKAMTWFWDQYAPDPTKRRQINASPINASRSELENLPPALIITAQNDVLRDEGEAYARLLNEAGVQVTCVRINGTIHDFLMLNDLADSAPSKTALDLAVCTLRQVFSK